MLTKCQNLSIVLPKQKTGMKVSVNDALKEVSLCSVLTFTFKVSCIVTAGLHIHCALQA